MSLLLRRGLASGGSVLPLPPATSSSSSLLSLITRREYGSGANTKKKAKAVGALKKQTKGGKRDGLTKKEQAAENYAVESKTKPLLQILSTQEGKPRKISEQQALDEQTYVREMTVHLGKLTRKQDVDMLRKMRLRDEALQALPAELRSYASREDHTHFPPQMRMWTHTPPSKKT